MLKTVNHAITTMTSLVDAKNNINIFKRLPHFDIFEIGTSIPIPGMTAGVRLPQLRDMNTVFT